MSEKLQKFLASAGIASRRKAEEIIAQGKVKINGEVATIGDRVDDDDRVIYKNKVVRPQTHVYLAFYKPRGYITSLSSKQGKSITPFIKKMPGKVFPVGRLDKDSEGLLLLTNDGDWANELAHPSHDHEKEYIVQLNAPITEEIIKDFSKGMRLDGRKLRPVRVKSTTKNKKLVTLVLKQGLNRQIRRMFEAKKIKVTYLKRVRVRGYHLGDLEPGQYKNIKP